MFSRRIMIFGLLMLSLLLFSGSCMGFFLEYPVEEESSTYNGFINNEYILFDFTANRTSINTYGWSLDLTVDSPVLVDSSDILYSEDDIIISGFIYNSSLDYDNDGYLIYGKDVYDGGYVYDWNGDGSKDVNDGSWWINRAVEKPYITYQWNVSGYNLPWDNCNYTVDYTASSYSSGAVIDTGSKWFWLGDYDSGRDYYFSIRDWVPRHLDFEGIVAVDEVHFSCISNDPSDRTIHLYATDDDRDIKAYGQRDIYFNSDSDGVRWQTYYIKSGVFEPEHVYYQYFGFTTSAYTFGNTEVTTDVSCYNCNFTTAGISLDGALHENNDDLTFDYIGGGLLFETGAVTEDGDGWVPDEYNPSDSFGDWIDDWANDPDVWGGTPPMPWFKTLVGVIFTVIFICLPLGFSIRTGITIPNFVYTVFITAGVFLSFILELFSLWILLTYIAILILISIMVYREELYSVIDVVSNIRRSVGPFGGMSSKKIEKAEKSTSKVSKSKSKLPKRIERDIGSSGNPRINYSERYEKSMAKKGYKKSGKWWVRD